MKYIILNQTKTNVLIELPSHKRTLKICNQTYFLLLPKIRLNLYIQNNQVKNIYVCFTNDQNQILIPKLNNIDSDLSLCCSTATANNLDDLIKQQIDLIFNTEFTDDYPQSTGFYEEWTELTKQNKIPEFEVCNHPFAIRFIPNSSEQLQLEAVKQDGYTIQYIENPSEQVQLEAVKEYEKAIQYIQNPTEQVQLVAVKLNWDSIKYIQNPSEEVQLEAVKQNGRAIKYIQNPSEQVQSEAVKQYSYAIQFISNPSEQVQLEAVKQTGWTIYYIQNPSELVQLVAVKQYRDSIKYIQNPSEQVKTLIT